MDSHCTCGTLLVENAAFCHRCGRPTREITAEEAPPPLPVAAAANTAAATSLAQLPVNFRNPLALRIAFVMALMILLLQMIPGLNLLFVIWWLGAGWAAVVVYRRLTGAVLSVRAGARLGSLTGILAFVSMTLTFAMSMLVVGNEFQAALQKQLEEAMKQTPEIGQVMHDPWALGTVFLVVLGIMFVMMVGTCAAGGALGARFAARNGMSQAPGA